jgi:hypothetical protein
VQTGKINRAGNNLGPTTGSKHATRRSSKVAATGMGNHNGIGVFSGYAAYLHNQLIAKAFDTLDPKRCVQRSIKIARFFEGQKQVIEKFGTD